MDETNDGVMVPTDEHSESPKHYRIHFHPKPDEMTFDQSLGHVKRTMYWDAVDGQWVQISLYPIEKWDVLAEQLSAAHAREMDVLREENVRLRSCLSDDAENALLILGENAKLRDLVREMSFPYKYGDFDCGLCPHTDKCWDSETLDFNPDGCVILQMVRELGIEAE